MLHILKTTLSTIKDCENKIGRCVFLGKETRLNHTAVYPLHNRYFSNGDKPWVILVNEKNSMKLSYADQIYDIKEGELVLFDDNIMHSWEMNNNDMTIYYYRASTDNPVMQGTYCLDDYF